MISPRLFLGFALAAAISGCTVVVNPEAPKPEVNEPTVETIVIPEKPMVVKEPEPLPPPKPEKIYIKVPCELPSLEEYLSLSPPDKVKFRYAAEANPDKASKLYIMALKNYSERNEVLRIKIDKEYERCLNLKGR